LICVQVLFKKIIKRYQKSLNDTTSKNHKHRIKPQNTNHNKTPQKVKKSSAKPSPPVQVRLSVASKENPRYIAVYRGFCFAGKLQICYSFVNVLCFFEICIIINPVD